MESQSLDLRWLWPDIGHALANPLADGPALSATVVIILFLIFAVFGLVFLKNFFVAQTRIKWLENLLERIDRDNVAENRISLREAAKKRFSRDKVVAHQWLEFDETLIEVNQRDGAQLRNTFDFGHFFNTHTIAKGATENRLIAAVPGFLTAVGVIGTFGGLQIGLSGLELGGSAEEMREGISSVVGGAKIAFMTSIWGIALSLLFNFLEKMFEQRIRARLAKVEAHVDWIFPRIRPEEQLYQIAEDGEESRKALQGLAERIGEKMQESLIQATEGIQQGLEASLQTIMAPAINKLVDETSEGNQKALEELLTKFMDGFGQQGQLQREAMEGASGKVNASIESMNRTLEAFVLKMENNQSQSSDREQQLVANISKQVISLSEQMSRQMTSAQQNNTQFTAELENKLSNMLSSIAENTRNMNATTSEQVTKFADHMLARAKADGEQVQRINDLVERQTDTVTNATSTILTSVEEGLQKYQARAELLLNQGASLQESMNQALEASTLAANEMNHSAKELRGSADSMAVLGSHMREAGNKLSGAISQAVESTKDLSMQNQVAAENIEALREQLLNDIRSFDQLAQRIEALFERASSTFDGLNDSQSRFLNQQKEHVDSLSSKMAQLLRDYATQANSQTAEHLRVWADSANDYAQQTTKAYKALQSIVDGIEEKSSNGALI